MNLFLEKWIMLILLAFEALLSLPGPVSLGRSYTSHLLISTYILIRFVRLIAACMKLYVS